jgi:hypothetical protein
MRWSTRTTATTTSYKFFLDGVGAGQAPGFAVGANAPRFGSLAFCSPAARLRARSSAASMGCQMAPAFGGLEL